MQITKAKYKKLVEQASELFDTCFTQKTASDMPFVELNVLHMQDKGGNTVKQFIIITGYKNPTSTHAPTRYQVTLDSAEAHKLFTETVSSYVTDFIKTT